MLPRRDYIRLSALTTLGAAAAARDAAADDLKTVRVLEVPTDGAKSVLYAEKAGLFRKRGIDANIVAVGSGETIFPAVVGGSADFGSGSLWPVFEAYAHGIPLRIIAPASLYRADRPDGFLLVAKDGPIKTPRDLNGKIIGGDAAKDIAIMAIRAWLDQHGGEGRSLRSIELRQTEQVAALDAGRVDAVLLKPPYLTVALETGKYLKLGTPYDAVAPRFALSCWVATADYIAKNPDTVKAFTAGLLEAAKYTNANQDATTGMVAAFSGQDAAILGRGIRSTTAETVTAADFQGPLEFAYKCGVIDQHFDLSGVLASTVVLSRGR
jgi:NitT/TauT family transport system substrate-binding protein